MKEFIEDNDGYTELGELHVERNKAVIGRIDSRYEKNRKHSLLPVDSSRIIQNFSSNVTIKDSAIIPSEGTFGEKQIYIGNNFLAIYDRNTGNFISENPRSYFKNVGVELGITSIDEYHMICDNIKNVVAVGKKFFVFTIRTYSIPVIIEIDPYANTVSVVNGPDDTLFNMIFNSDSSLPKYTIIGKPFCFNSETIGIICRKEVDDNSKFNVSVLKFNINKYVAGIVGDESSGIEGYLTEIKFDKPSGVVNLEDNSSVFSFYKDNVIYLIQEQTQDSSTDIGFGYCLYINRAGNGTEQTPEVTMTTRTNGSLTNIKSIVIDDTSSEVTSEPYKYFIIANEGLFSFTTELFKTGSVNVTESTFSSPSGETGSCLYIFAPEYESENMFLIFSSGNIYKISPTSQNRLNGLVSSTLDFERITSNVSSITVSGAMYSNNTIILFGTYKENETSGSVKPFIKEYDLNEINDILVDETKSGSISFLSGLESETYISKLTGKSFGKTKLSRVHIIPQLSSDDEVELYIKEDETNLESKFTSGKILWNALKESGIPYNTHVKTIGRIIIDGIDVPIENVMITRKDSEENDACGSVLLTFDKNFDLSVLQKISSENAKIKYPGILFRNNSGFIEDAMISNVFSVDGSFCYNDQENGKLFGSNLDNFNVVKTELYTTASDKKVLIIATGKKIASIDTHTGNYTNCEGVDIGDSENTPKIYFNSQLGDNEIIEDIEILNDKLYIFTSQLNVYTIDLTTKTLSNEVSSYYISSTTEINQKHNPIRIGNTVFFANVGYSNTSYNYQTIVAFDLEENVFIRENETNLIDFSLSSIGSRISQKVKFGDNVYFGVALSSNIDLYKFNLRTRKFSKEHTFNFSENVTSFDISSNYVSKIYVTAHVSDGTTSDYQCIPYDVYTNTEETFVETNNAFDGEILATAVLNNSLFVAYGSKASFNVKLRNLETNINWEVAGENFSLSSLDITDISPIQIYDGTTLKLLFAIHDGGENLYAQGISISVNNNVVSVINNTNEIEVKGEATQIDKRFIILDGDTLVSYKPSSNENDKFDFIYCEGSNVIYLYYDSENISTKLYSFDTRTETKQEITPFFLSVASTIEKKFVSAFNFTYKNQVLVVSYEDGSIASWKISGTKTYYPSNYRDAAYEFIAKHTVRITMNPTIVGGSITVGEVYDKTRSDLITWFETNVTDFKANNPSLYDENERFRSDLNLLMFAYNNASSVIDDAEVDIKDLRAKPSSDPISPSGVYFAVFTDQNEPYIGRSRSCVYANAGEFLTEGATSVDRVGNDLIFRTPTNSLVWAEDIGCFFKGNNEKYTGMKENEKNSLPKNPICEAGVASCGKYVFYVNGYDNSEQTNPWKTVHTGVSVLNTETGEIATLYDGKDLLYGTLEARVKPFCVYKNGYLYVLCGFARYNDRVMGQNIAGLRRSDAIEVIDLDTGTTTYIGSFEAHSKTFDPTSSESPSQADLKDTFFFNEVEDDLYVGRLGDSIQSFNSLTGKTEAIVSHGDDNGVDTDSLVYIPFGKYSSSKYIKMYTDNDEINIEIPTNTPTVLTYQEQENPIITNPCRINDGSYIFSIITTNTDGSLNRVSYAYDGDNSLSLIESTNLENRTISRNNLSVYPSRKYSKLDNDLAVCDDLYNDDQGKFSYLHEFIRTNNKKIEKEDLNLGSGFIKELYKSNIKYIVSFNNQNIVLTRISEVKNLSTSIGTPSSSKNIKAFFTDTSTVTILQIDGTTVHAFSVDTVSMTIVKRRFTKALDIVSNVIFANGKIQFLYKESDKIYHGTLENIGNGDNSENVILNSWEFVTIEESDVYDISIRDNLLNVCSYNNGKVTISKYTIDSTSLANGFESKFDITGIVLPFIFEWLTLLSDGNVVLRSSDSNNYAFSFVNNFTRNGKSVIIPKADVYDWYNFDNESVSYYVSKSAGLYDVVNVKSFMFTINQSNKVKNVTSYTDGDIVHLSTGKELTVVSKNSEIFIYNKKLRNVSSIDIGENVTNVCACKNNVIAFTENKNIYNITETNVIPIENVFSNITAISGRCLTGYLYYFEGNILHKFITDESRVEFVHSFDSIDGDIISIKEMEDGTIRFLTSSDLSSSTKKFNVYEYYIPNEETRLVSTFNKEGVEECEPFIDINGNIVIPKTFNTSFTSEKFFTVINGCDPTIEYNKTYTSEEEFNFLKLAISSDEIVKLFVSDDKLYLSEELYELYSWGYSEFTFNNDIFDSAKLTFHTTSYFTYKVNGDNINIYSKETKQLVSYIETQGQISNVIGVKAFVNGLVYVIGYNGTNLQRCVYSLKSKQLISQTKTCDTEISLADAYCDFVGKFAIVFNGDGSKAIVFDFINLRIKQITSSQANKIFGYYNGNLLESSTGHAGCVIRNGKQAVLCDDSGYSVGETSLTKTNYKTVSTNEENVTLIPSSNNKVLISSNISDVPYKALKLNPTFSKRFSMGEFFITIFSGVTEDLIVCENSQGLIIDRLKVEREYGCYAKNVSKYDETKCFITYSEGIFISTLYVSENGELTMKRYDGTLFGKLLNIGNNVHTIQEVDFTLLFDETESELGI